MEVIGVYKAIKQSKGGLVNGESYNGEDDQELGTDSLAVFTGWAGER